MKKKFSFKTILIIVIMLLVGVLGVLGVNTARTYLSGASADLAPKNVSAKVGEDGRSAVVSWVSDKAEMGVVEYGTTPASLLLRALESEATTAHSINLTPLKANTNYYFHIRIGEEVFDNNGIPYSFRTKASTDVLPTTMPVVSLVPTIASQSSGTTGGTCSRDVDYNKDGVVNSLDYLNCVNKVPTPSVGSSSATNDCQTVGDYNKDGVVNSLDRLKCLQDKK